MTCHHSICFSSSSLKDNPYMAILTFLIGYNNLIPISLYMTTDLVRALQAFIMESDESMYHKDSESGCKVRSSGLCEDLGQVDFVLSDKTGTLTQNEMCFKACYVDGQTYGYWSETPDDSREAEDASISTEFLGYPSDHIERLPPRSVCMPLSALPQGRVLMHLKEDQNLKDLRCIADVVALHIAADTTIYHHLGKRC